jgi:DNA-binding response OmpR family regulator
MSKKTTIVIIDDDPLMRIALKTLLHKEGYEVHEAADGEEGLKKILEVNPDAILCDRVMPGMSGVALLTKLEEIGRRTVPFVFMTTLTDPRDKSAVADLQPDGYIEKPFSIATVRACLAQILKPTS